PTTYLVDTTLSYASDYDQTALAGRLLTAWLSDFSSGDPSLASTQLDMLTPRNTATIFFITASLVE
ncbi:hypothetical protein RZO84_25040, partial [Citrobacter freundii]|nr:hypothetical protein [Citrobacter freundii]MEB0709031.1 hypothetical protein [Citrobacter freundii]